ncbi:hypothetical protein [Cupriavidus necator]|uniref:hypothetical protein n=1 Tax=Cupriavidus necator TaxID=106590 RepID=UPI00339D7CFC
MRKALASKDRIEFYAFQASSIEQAAEKGRASVAQARKQMRSWQPLREDFQQVAAAHYGTRKCSLQDIMDGLSQQTAHGGALSAWLAVLASANTFCESVHQATKEAVELTESQLANTATTVWATQRPKAQSARASASSSRERICHQQQLVAHDAVSRSGFYAWNGRSPSPRQARSAVTMAGLKVRAGKFVPLSGSASVSRANQSAASASISLSILSCPVLTA